MSAGADEGLELPLPAMAVQEESLFEVTADTLDALLLFLGLDNAGKTTLMQMLKNDRVVAQVPTLHPSCEELIIDKVRYKAMDLAGHETGRRLWKEYFAIAGAVLFLVDSSDRSRFAEAAEELSVLMKEPLLAAVPLAVLAQKVDISGAASEDEFKSAMGLSSTQERPVNIFMCSVVERRGYADAIRWIQEFLLEHRMPVIPSTSTPGEPPANAGGLEDEEDMMV
eukprot:CAMPEP_0115113196 /NCGR_PEP_ID=MMETSP0227-20121206/41183_1 /TAXON_ID=89957 /ORGANISM="Polarella glacialis, Strain CCMP 1383" /LENGTH=224 /DNA_ID=CAMNT_0002513091 /DNA_START=70 /DNA_END=744 /DNA_ORIENTATION=-